MAPASRKEFLDTQENYRVQIYSETRTSHDNNITEMHRRDTFSVISPVWLNGRIVDFNSVAVT